MAQMLIKGFVVKNEVTKVTTERGDFLAMKALIADESYKSKNESVAFFNVDFSANNQSLVQKYASILHNGARVLVKVNVIPDSYKPKEVKDESTAKSESDSYKPKEVKDQSTATAKSDSEQKAPEKILLFRYRLAECPRILQDDAFAEYSAAATAPATIMGGGNYTDADVPPEYTVVNEALPF